MEFIYENLLRKTRNTSSKTDVTCHWHTKKNLYGCLHFISMSTVTILPQGLETTVTYLLTYSMEQGPSWEAS